LDKYAGEYEFEYPPTNFVIANENGKLTAQRNGESKQEMFAESETKFFLKTEDIQFTFVKSADGTVTGLIVHQGDGTLYEVMNGQKIK
jgi:diacylglycerol kinase family enzyme